MTLAGTTGTELRRGRLKEILAEHGRVELQEASRSLNVHPMTIRRDLEVLEREGLARRVRGGAIYLGAEGYQQRRVQSLPAKRRIAEKLLGLVKADSAIGLDASTTMLQMASMLSGHPRLSVVTNGLIAFQLLQGKRGIKAYLTGGESEEENAALVGPIAVKALSGFLLNACFLSASCLDPAIGTSEPTTAEVEVKQAMAATAEQVILAVDASKLGTRSVARGLPLSRIDLLVTELSANDKRLDPYRDVVQIL